MLTKTVRVEVTAEDIAVGRRKDCVNCPIALAIKRALQITSRCAVTVMQDRARVLRWTVAIPETVRLFIAAFDQLGGRPVSPFAFDLEVPTEALAC